MFLAFLHHADQISLQVLPQSPWRDFLCMQVKIYLALEVLKHLIELLAACTVCGLAEPHAMVAKLKQERMLVMGAVRRVAPGTFERIVPRYKLPLPVNCLAAEAGYISIMGAAHCDMPGRTEHDISI